MSCVAIVIAVDEVRPDFPQVVRADGLIARHARGSRARRPPIHQNESHVAAPNEKQNPRIGWLETIGWRSAELRPQHEAKMVP